MSFKAGAHLPSKAAQRDGGGLQALGGVPKESHVFSLPKLLLDLLLSPTPLRTLHPGIPLTQPCSNPSLGTKGTAIVTGPVPTSSSPYSTAAVRGLLPDLPTVRS